MKWTRGQALTIGEVAARGGVTVATLRYYEQRGLVVAERTPGNQRRYARAVLRRLAFIRPGQRVGLSLDEMCLGLRLGPSLTDIDSANWAGPCLRANH